MSARASRTERRELRFAARRRMRGGERRAPVPVQRLARQVSDTAVVAREAGAAAASSNQFWLIGAAAVMVLGMSIISGPIDQYFAGRDRVQLLETKLDALTGENARLAARAEALQDPGQVEHLARELQGWHMPGEVPFAIVPPDSDGPLVDEALPPASAPDHPWYRDAWDWFTGLFG
ncbi:MAG: septum formation initiator family protein [Nitriliruptorales bacterium]|nr:septum formation initiator family protein [Nitriliruptorales bacterium]